MRVELRRHLELVGDAVRVTAVVERDLERQAVHHVAEADLGEVEVVVAGCVAPEVLGVDLDDARACPGIPASPTLRLRPNKPTPAQYR